MIPQETDKTVPDFSYPERPETLTLEELTPSKSFHQRMQRDPEFRFNVEEHQ